MTHLHAFNPSQEISSTAELQKAGAQSIQTEQGKQIPKVSDSDFADKLAELNKLPLWDRECKIVSMRDSNNIPVTLDMKLRFLQPVLEQKLREAETYDAILIIFQQGILRCFEGEVFNSQLFDSYIKPVIEKVAREREMHITLQGITMILKRVPSLLSSSLTNFLQTDEIFSPHHVERYFSEHIKVLFDMFYLWCICDIHNTGELHDFCARFLPITKMKFNYTMEDADAVVVAGALELTETLTSLDFSGGASKIGDAGAVALAEALKVNKTLTSLNLIHSEIGAAGAVALAEALKVNKTLTTLHLNNSEIGDAGIVALAKALEVNETLTSLTLDRIPIGTENVVALAEALKKNKTLRSLGLRSSHLGVEGARVLAGALKVNGTLTSLNLEGNQLGAEGVKVLAEALEVNKALTSLNLGDNLLDADDSVIIGRRISSGRVALYSLKDTKSASAIALAKALKENRTLTSLYLGSNFIKDESAKLLAEALEVNETLTNLNLKDNKIGNVGAIAIAYALTKNRALTSLNLENNEIGSIGVVMLAASRAESDMQTSFCFGNNHKGANSLVRFQEEISTFYKGSNFQF